MKKKLKLTAWCTDQNKLPQIYSHETSNVWGLVFSDTEMSCNGWIRIGTATIHLDLIDPKDTIDAQVEALEAQCKKVMADSEATLTMLRSRINDLLAIENGGVDK